ncbi:MAG: efflux RND transporter periplasmic adaptor subunit [Bacteroidales bacterium]|jgi:membrane fusion protein (multidrug efflux system)|nr:efflux RND transporter periplasmic adaptor subunit [Bacteroidales bacterium]
MKKGSKIALWISIPLVLAVGFAGPRLGLFGNGKVTEEKGSAAAGAPATVQASQAAAPGQGQRGPQGGAVLPVSGQIAKPSYLSNGIRSAGSLLANEEVDIVSKVSGKVTGVFFREGSVVRKGDMMVKIYDEDLQAQLRRSQIQEKMLSEKLERQRVLLSKDAVSRESFDQLQTDYNVILADINLLKVRIAETEVRAPFDGIIGFRYVSEGTYVQPSVKIAHLTDNSQLKLEFGIAEKYISQPLTNKKVSFTVPGYKDEFFAQVYAIDYRVDEATRTIGVRARTDNRDGRLVPGMFAEITLITDERENAILVPTEAVVPDMNEKRVWVLRGGKAVLTPVTSGNRTQNMIEILSGISVGDTVITSGLMQLRPNMAVRVNIAD